MRVITPVDLHADNATHLAVSTNRISELIARPKRRCVIDLKRLDDTSPLGKNPFTDRGQMRAARRFLRKKRDRSKRSTARFLEHHDAIRNTTDDAGLNDQPACAKLFGSLRLGKLGPGRIRNMRSHAIRHAKMRMLLV